MSAPDDSLNLTWPNGPTLTLTRTHLCVLPPQADVGPLSTPVARWLRGVWHPWMWGPKPLTAAKLEFDGTRLLYYRTRRIWDFWEVPLEHAGAVACLVDEFRRRRELREQHLRRDGAARLSRGQSLLPWLLLLALAIWLVRRARRSRKAR